MKTRRRELRDLIKKALNDTDGSSRVLYLAKQVWKAEKQMVENRECLTLLFDRGFFTDEEMMNHLNKCFELFQLNFKIQGVSVGRRGARVPPPRRFRASPF